MRGEVSERKENIATLIVKRRPSTDLYGYELKLPSVQEQAWERHGAQGWLGLREIAVMRLGRFGRLATLEALCKSA